ncbi:MAG: ribosomal protein [Chloroflexi bacterium]|nr:ribosomal protein [Chloroflexota bacterium]
MYAVIETGGKQYRVEVGTELEVELLEVTPGDAITLDRVLLVADGDKAAIGRPIVENASVAAQVVRQTRGEKLINFKYGPKTRRRVKKGHRQELTVLRISDIVLDGRSAAADAAKAIEAKLTERQRLEDAARRQAEADAQLAAKLKPAATSKVESAAAPDAKSAPKTKTAPRAAAAPKAKAAPRASAAAPETSAEKPKRTRAAKKDE